MIIQVSQVLSRNFALIIALSLTSSVKAMTYTNFALCCFSNAFIKNEIRL